MDRIRVIFINRTHAKGPSAAEAPLVGILHYVRFSRMPSFLQILFTISYTLCPFEIGQ